MSVETCHVADSPPHYDFLVVGLEDLQLLNLNSGLHKLLLYRHSTKFSMAAYPRQWVDTSKISTQSGAAPSWLSERISLKRPVVWKQELRARLRKPDFRTNHLSYHIKTITKQETYANVKLSTFCTAATAVPLIVIFVMGVLWSVALPYQSIASTEAWPPSQLQLKPMVRYYNKQWWLDYVLDVSVASLWVISVGKWRDSSRNRHTQIRVLSRESTSAESSGSQVLASWYKYRIRKMMVSSNLSLTSPVFAKWESTGSEHSLYVLVAPIFFKTEASARYFV